VIKTAWNEKMRPDASIKGFVYGQQKSIALFNCTGDWAFYLEGDEVVHEDDLPVIRTAMEKHLEDDRVECLFFDYLHFYGNPHTLAWSPGWYRTAPRIIRNTIPCWAPKGLFFIVLEDRRRGRYPRAARSGARIFHYGWARGEERVQANKDQIEKYWGRESPPLDFREIDARILKPFTGTHPKVLQDWLPKSDGIFQPNPAHRRTSKEKKHRLMMKIERLFGVELSRKYYTLVR
ncbi:MAG: glycosyltransferase, partial [Verrucomicrobia bacterium]|nr:glycosyltransferase [Verrucomicrobiota bacterium]